MERKKKGSKGQGVDRTRGGKNTERKVQREERTRRGKDRGRI